MSAAPKKSPSNASDTKTQRDSMRLTLLERIVERSTIDVAACIRWTFFGAAAVILAIYAAPRGRADVATAATNLVTVVANVSRAPRDEVAGEDQAGSKP